MKQKGFVPILIIIFLAAAALGGFLIYQNQVKPTPSPQPAPLSDSIANWKTYKSTAYGFEFRYPANLFELKEKINPTSTIKLRIHLEQISTDVNYIDVYFDISTDSEENILKTTGVSFDKDRVINIDGIQANKYAGFGGIGGDVYNEIVIIPKKDLNYYFEFGTLDDKKKDLLNEILTTFKFIQ